MNSYNDNLRNSVVKTLNAQELQLKNAAAALSAQEVSLYYSQGALVSEHEKLDKTFKLYKDRQATMKAATKNNNIAINLLDTANEFKSSMDLGVTNCATAAANVQVANNAIVHLASDLGSIYGIVNAADFDTQIYHETKKIKEMIDNTAYSSEVASQMAMESSMLMSEVSSGTVQTDAVSTGANMQTAFDTLKAAFDEASQELDAQSTSTATASATEKKNEGALEDTNVLYYATQKAFKVNNDELNMGISVPANSKRNSEKRTNMYFTAEFNEFTPAFGEDDENPVKGYYIFLVKSSSQSTFSTAIADSLMHDPKHFVKLLPKDVKDGMLKTIIYTNDIVDSDGDEMELGEDYVIFVLTEFTETYKKKLNDFEDKLSAASNDFVLTNKLNSPVFSEIGVETTTMEDPPSGDDPGENTKGKAKSKKEKVVQKLKFTLEENATYNLEYRIFFLPDNSGLVSGLLTSNGLRRLQRDVEKLEEIADQYDPQIAKLQQTVTDEETKIELLTRQSSEYQSEIDELTTQLQADDITDKKRQSLQAKKKTLGEKQKKIQSDLKSLKKSYKLNKTRLSKLIEDKTDAESKLDPVHYVKPGFYFNTALAEQVPAGSYTVQTLQDVNDESKEDDEFNVKRTVEFEIHNDMTDNFGNKLEEGARYVPAVLSYAIEGSETLNQFTNSLSRYQQTNYFIYQS